MNWLSKLFGKVNLFKGKTVYERYAMGDAIPTLDQENLIARNRKLLLDNQVPITKVRFVFQPSFHYDVDKNVVNPKYNEMLPIDGNTGLFVKDAPVISIGKPEKLITVNILGYKVDDNYAFIKGMLKKTKRGLVIFIVDELVYDLFNHNNGVRTHYHFGVYTDSIRLVNLDAVVEHYQSQGLL